MVTLREVQVTELEEAGMFALILPGIEAGLAMKFTFYI